MSHRNARLNVRGRQLLVERVCDQGWAVAHAAKAQGVSRQCAHRWIKRFRQEGEAGLYDRSSRPHHCPCQTGPQVEEQVLACRRAERRGQDWIGPEVGVPARTVSRILRRNGVAH
ncbi:MAG: leucine zipper domain-containing protein, partial [Micromonosporaceae bacterium]